MNYQNVKAQLVKQLSVDEGDRLVVYDDATGLPIKAGTHVIGNPTIGTGRNLSGKGISDFERQFLLSNDISDVAKDLDTHFDWWESLSDASAYVLMQMCFNMGITKLSTFEKFLAAVKTGDKETAAAEMVDSAWYNQVGDRAKRLVTIMKSGILSPM